MVNGLRELARELRESCSWEQHEHAADVLERLAAEQEAAQASLLRVRSHANWLVGFLSVQGPGGCETFREYAHRKAQELLAEITAAQTAPSEPEGGAKYLVGASAGEEVKTPRASSGSLDAEADAALREAAEGFEQIAGCTPHVRGCDEPDDPHCARCIADSEAARAREALDRLLAGKAAG